MTIGFHLADELTRHTQASVEAKSFDPDRRLDMQPVGEGYEGSFNPDRRVPAEDEKTGMRNDVRNSESLDSEIEKTAAEYFDDLKNMSEVPDTIQDKPFDTSELRRLLPEEVAKRREEFYDKKAALRREWEVANGREWPKYEHDIVVNDYMVRKAGDNYDAHHIKPLSIGGMNEAVNITPISMEKHQGREGIHAKGRPCDKLVQLVGGRQQ